jgi:hypothetical protein
MGTLARSEMSRRVVKGTSGICELCSKHTRHLAKFNDVLLCARCFDQEITAFIERRIAFKLKVAAA